VLKKEAPPVRQSPVVEGRLVALRFGGDAEVYANRGMLWLRLQKTPEADADFAQRVALNPDMKFSLEQRINQLQAQFPIQTRR